jgi:uncharacterized membrane protein SpoIIM required for sporulation
MKVAELLESRRANWNRLESLCAQMESRNYRRTARNVAQFAALYRAACADLALADAYQLPPSAINYLHQLVARSHNQLYRSRMFEFRRWGEEMFVKVPARLFKDNALRLSFAIFWGLFLASMFLSTKASPLPQFAENVLGKEMMKQFETSFENPIGGSGNASGMESGMAGFYIWHNASIGLRCFAAGLIFGVVGLFELIFNAVYLGAAFGYMTQIPQRENFYHFVTAHGPFELTAVVLAAAAGMKLGFALVMTGGLSRTDSLRKAARETLPTAAAAVVLFGLAAMIEGFISPSALPYEIKATVAVFSTGLLLFYFVFLGYPRDNVDAV